VKVVRALPVIVKEVLLLPTLNIYYNLAAK